MNPKYTNLIKIRLKNSNKVIRLLVIDIFMGIAVALALGCVTAEILLIYIFTKRYFANNKPQSILFLIIALIFILIGDGFGLLGMFIPEGQLTLFTFLSRTSYVTTILSAVTFLFFYEIFDSDSMFGLKQLIITIFGTLVLASFFLHSQTINYNSTMQVYMVSIDSMTILLNKILPVLVGISVLVTIFNNYSLAWKMQKRQLTILGVGAFIGYISPHVFIEPFQSQIVSVVGPGLFMVSVRVWVAVGFIIYWYSFGSSEFFGFLQRQHAQELVMIAEGGIPLYSYNFKSGEKVLEDEMLFGGAITAIGSLFKESLGASAVKDISLDDGRKLLFRPFEGYGYNLILITPKSSKYLHESMTRFGTKVRKLFSSVDNVMETAKIAQNGDSVIFESFGLPQ